MENSLRRRRLFVTTAGSRGWDHKWRDGTVRPDARAAAVMHVTSMRRGHKFWNGFIFRSWLLQPLFPLLPFIWSFLFLFPSSLIGSCDCATFSNASSEPREVQFAAKHPSQAPLLHRHCFHGHECRQSGPVGGDPPQGQWSRGPV